MLLTIALGLILMSDPLLSASDALDRGATCVYTTSVVEGMDYWVLLHLENQESDFDMVVASRDMDFDRFMTLPYREDYEYAREYAIAEGI